jgi:hypothetical protein
LPPNYASVFQSGAKKEWLVVTPSNLSPHLILLERFWDQFIPGNEFNHFFKSCKFVFKIQQFSFCQFPGNGIPNLRDAQKHKTVEWLPILKSFGKIETIVTN